MNEHVKVTKYANINEKMYSEEKYKFLFGYDENTVFFKFYSENKECSNECSIEKFQRVLVNETKSRLSYDYFIHMMDECLTNNKNNYDIKFIKKSTLGEYINLQFTFGVNDKQTVVNILLIYKNNNAKL